MIYLDHNATTPVHPEVVEAMLPYLRTHFGNPSSNHPVGRAAKAGVDRARAQVAALLGCDAAEVIFTSGGTESNNLALHGVAATRSAPGHCLSTTVEHPAVREPLAALERAGWRCDRVGVDETGRVDAAAVLSKIGPDTAFLSVMHANNEVGTLQPIAEIAAGADSVVVHTDAAQSVGKVPVDVRALGVDLLTVAGHKLYAPKGVGALYVRSGVRLEPFVRGASHESGLRPGTENVAGIVGLGEACRLAGVHLAESTHRQRTQRDRLWALLRAAVADLALHGHPTERLPNTLNVRFPGTTGTQVLAGAPDIAASTGSACHAHGESPSGVLLAMGLSPTDALGAVRLSLGHTTTEAQVDAAAAALIQSWRALSEA